MTTFIEAERTNREALARFRSAIEQRRIDSEYRAAGQALNQRGIVERL